MSDGRYQAPHPVDLAEGWQLERLTPPSRLYGANGLRTGADGRVYVAQVAGSQVSAIDIASGAIETVSPLGATISPSMMPATCTPPKLPRGASACAAPMATTG